MKKSGDILHYFPSNVPITRKMWERLHLDDVLTRMQDGRGVPEIVFIRQVADSLNRLPIEPDRPSRRGSSTCMGCRGESTAISSTDIAGNSSRGRWQRPRSKPDILFSPRRPSRLSPIWPIFSRAPKYLPIRPLQESSLPVTMRRRREKCPDPGTPAPRSVQGKLRARPVPRAF